MDSPCRTVVLRFWKNRDAPKQKRVLCKSLSAAYEYAKQREAEKRGKGYSGPTREKPPTPTREEEHRTPPQDDVAAPQQQEEDDNAAPPQEDVAAPPQEEDVAAPSLETVEKTPAASVARTEEVDTVSAPVVETAAPVVVRGKRAPKDWHNTSYYVKLKGEWLLARVDSEKGLPFKVNMHGLGEEGDKKFHFMYTLALFLKDVASLEKERSLVWMEDDYPSDLVEALNTAASIGKPEVAVAGRTACTEARHAFQSLEVGGVRTAGTPSRSRRPGRPATATSTTTSWWWGRKSGSLPCAPTGAAWSGS